MASKHYRTANTLCSQISNEISNVIFQLADIVDIAAMTTGQKVTAEIRQDNFCYAS